MAKVKSGAAIAALVIPEDLTDRLQGLQTLALDGPPTIEVYYNADDPVKRRRVKEALSAAAERPLRP